MVRTQHSESGFTLLELMVALLVMGILVAIAVPVYSINRDNSLRDEARSSTLNAAVKINSARGGQPAVYPAALPPDVSQATGDAKFIYSYTQDQSEYCLIGTQNEHTIYYSSASGGFVDESCEYDDVNRVITLGFTKVSSDGGATATNFSGFFTWNTVAGATKYVVAQSNNTPLLTITEDSTLLHKNDGSTSDITDSDFSGTALPTRSPVINSPQDINLSGKTYKIMAYDVSGKLILSSTPAYVTNINTNPFTDLTGAVFSQSVSSDDNVGKAAYYNRYISWNTIVNHPKYASIKNFIITDSGTLGTNNKQFDREAIVAELPKSTTQYMHTQRLDDRHAKETSVNDLNLYAVADPNNDGKTEVYNLPLAITSMNYNLSQTSPRIDKGTLGTKIEGGVTRVSFNIVHNANQIMKDIYSTESEFRCTNSANAVTTFKIPRSTSGSTAYSVEANKYTTCTLYTVLNANGKYYSHISNTLSGKELVR